MVEPFGPQLSRLVNCDRHNKESEAGSVTGARNPDALARRNRVLVAPCFSPDGLEVKVKVP